MENNNSNNTLPFVMAKIDKVMNNENSLKAFATITIANCFTVKDVKVMQSKNGLFVSMPNRSFVNNNGEKKFTDVCHATNKEMHQRITDVVINAYTHMMNQTAQESSAPTPVQSIPTAQTASEVNANPINEVPQENLSPDYDFVPIM